MLVFFNGRLIEESEAAISIHDRGFLYGDGLFETLRVVNGRPVRWTEHYSRLSRGANFFQIPLLYYSGELQKFASELVSENKTPESVIRIHLSRGPGARGYSPRNSGPPTLVMAVYPVEPIIPGQPKLWRLAASPFRVLASDPLASFKHSNKLPHICARAEAESAGADEALLLNNEGQLAETTSANLFWVERNVLCTPPPASGALPGIVRSEVLALAYAAGLQALEKNSTPDVLESASAVFCTNSVHGIIEITHLNGRPAPRSAIPAKLNHLYWQKALSQD